MKNFGGGKKPFKAPFKAPNGPKRGPVPKEQSKRKQPTLKNQVRSLERLVRLERLDPKIKAAKEKELEGLKRELGDHHRQELEKKYSKRYHHVKFFERVKIERSIAKLERKTKLPEGEEGAGLSKEEEAQLEQLKDDLLYVMHFPKCEKYVSLLKNASEPEGQAALDLERQRLRQLVRQQMSETAAVTEADEGRGLAKAIPDGGVAGKRKRADAHQAQDEEEVEEDDFFLGASDEEEGKEEEKGIKQAKGGKLEGQPPQPLRHKAAVQQSGASAGQQKREQQQASLAPAAKKAKLPVPGGLGEDGRKPSSSQRAEAAPAGLQRGKPAAGRAATTQDDDDDSKEDGSDEDEGGVSLDDAEEAVSESDEEEGGHPLLATLKRKQQLQQQHEGRGAAITASDDGDSAGSSGQSGSSGDEEGEDAGSDEEEGGGGHGLAPKGRPPGAARGGKSEPGGFHGAGRGGGRGAPGGRGQGVQGRGRGGARGEGRGNGGAGARGRGGAGFVPGRGGDKPGWQKPGEPSRGGDGGERRDHEKAGGAGKRGGARGGHAGPAAAKLPVRSRAEGGRKRRK